MDEYFLSLEVSQQRSTSLCNSNLCAYVCTIREKKKKKQIRGCIVSLFRRCAKRTGDRSIFLPSAQENQIMNFISFELPGEIGRTPISNSRKRRYARETESITTRKFHARAIIDDTNFTSFRN